MKLLSTIIIGIILISTTSTASAFGFSTRDGFFDWDNDDYYDRRPWGYDSRYRDSRRYYDDWDRPAYKPPVRDSFYSPSPRSRYGNRDYRYQKCPPCECNCNKAEQKPDEKKAQNKTEAASENQ